MWVDGYNDKRLVGNFRRAFCVMRTVEIDRTCLSLGERSTCGFDGFVNQRFGVCEGNKRGFKL